MMDEKASSILYKIIIKFMDIEHETWILNIEYIPTTWADRLTVLNYFE